MRNPVRFIACSFAGICLTTAAAVAQTPDIDAQYAQEQQYCATLPEPSRAACLKEAAAVRQERRKGAHAADSGSSYRLNRVTRCDRLPAQEREACLKLMSETAQPNTYGSVEGGGVLRELRIEVPAPVQPQALPPQTPQAPSPAIPLPLGTER